MSNLQDNLIWIDLEMSGLDTVHDKIIEIAIIVTDSKLNIIAEGPVIAIHQPPSIIQGMDAWNQITHSKSGLIQRVETSDGNEESAELHCLDFLKQYTVEGASPMCGNSICQDRRFLFKDMPRLEKYFHYRNLDVSTLKILASRLRPDILKGLEKSSTHQALQDIKDSIDELRYYYQNFLKLN